MTRRLALLALTLACASATPAPTASGGPPVAASQALTAPSGPGAGTSSTSVSDLSLTTFPNAGRHSFIVDQGQLVVLDAWATWCGPCVRSLPQLQALRRDYAARGVRVYAVSVDEDRSRIQPFLAKAGLDLPILLDPGGYILEDKLNLKQMPTTWVIDRTGHVRFTQEAYGGNLDDIRGQVDALLKEGT